MLNIQTLYDFIKNNEINYQGIILFIILLIIGGIGNIQTFKQQREKGGKAIIPIYNQYTEYKLFGSIKTAKLIAIIQIMQIILLTLYTITIIGEIEADCYQKDPQKIFIAALIICTIVGIIITVLNIKKDFKRIKKYSTPNYGKILIIIGNILAPIIINPIFVNYQVIQYKKK